MAVKDLVSDAIESAKDLLLDHDRNAKESSPPPRDAIALLKADHREVEALFKTILSDEQSTLRGQRANIEKVLSALALHAKIEETIFYPAVYEKTKKNTDERLNVLEAYEEHGSMKDLMRKIARADTRDESLKAKVQVLSEITKHHVTEEESEFFHEAREILGEKRLFLIGKELQALKDRSQKRLSPMKKTSKKKAPTAASTKRKRTAE